VTPGVPVRVAEASSSRDGQQSRVCAQHALVPSGQFRLVRSFGYLRQVLASVSALSGSLSHSQPGKTMHVEKSSGTSPSTLRDSQTGTARSFEPTRSRHLGGTRMHKSRETGTGSFRTRPCQAQFVPTGGRFGRRSEAGPIPESLRACSGRIELSIEPAQWDIGHWADAWHDTRLTQRPAPGLRFTRP
jgi:hypothetical protein